MFKYILVRFGELSLKGKNKMSFVYQLAKNIRKICKINANDMDVQIDRIFLPYSQENMENLGFVFGISSFSPVIKCDSNLEEITNSLIKSMASEKKTFKISSRRKWKEFSLDSLEMNQYFGSVILKNFDIKVDVRNPELEISIEVHQKFTYIFVDKIKGLGGLPVGVSGTVIHLLSGGIDSPVAALEMLKRGVNVIPLAFISPPHTDQLTIDKLHQISNLINKYQGSTHLILFNYTDIMNYIGLTSNQAYKIILMRRSFYRIANQIAIKNNCLGISNGENLGQVASQTMEAMHVIHSQSKLPVYQPLLTYDKLETIEKAQKFKTFEISIIKACETCELFAPDKPATKPNLQSAEDLEKELPMLEELEKKCLENKIENVYLKI